MKRILCWIFGHKWENWTGWNVSLHKKKWDKTKFKVCKRCFISETIESQDN